MPAETSMAICSFIFSGLLDRYPNLRVMFAHGGGSFPGTLGRIEHGFNCRPDLVACDNPTNPKQYVKKFFIDSLVHDESALKLILEVFGSDNIVLGSDYPFPLGELEPGKLLVESNVLSEDDKRKILWNNAFKWMGIKDDLYKDALGKDE
jgi:aminocarboxymuconate-semialdehyde decarboxylase